MYLSFHLAISLSDHLTLYLPFCLSVFLFVFLPIYLSNCLSVCLSVCRTSRNSARLPAKWKVASPKLSNSARLSRQHHKRSILRDFLNFWPDNVRNEAILRDFLQTRTVECIADDLVPMRFAICFMPPSKVLRLPQKSQTRSYMKCYTATLCHAKSPWQTWRSDAPKFQPLSGNQRPDLLTCLMENVSCTAPATQKASLQIHFKRPMPTIVFETGAKTSRVATFLQKCRIHCACQQKWCLNIHLRTCGAFAILTSICASRHSCVHKTSASKSARNVVCFVHFDFKLCFALQRRALSEEVTF